MGYGEVSSKMLLIYCLDKCHVSTYSVGVALASTGLVRLAAGAQLDLCNCRGCNVRDFVQQDALPEYLLQGLDGCRAECGRVSSLAASRGHMESSRHHDDASADGTHANAEEDGDLVEVVF